MYTSIIKHITKRGALLRHYNKDTLYNNGYFAGYTHGYRDGESKTIIPSLYVGFISGFFISFILHG